MNITLIDLIEDWKTYNPKRMTNAQLADDWRFCCAFYKSLKRGNPITAVYGGKKIPLKIDMLINMAGRIVKERLVRGKTFHPKDMKPFSRELFERIISKFKIKFEDWFILDINKENIDDLTPEDIIQLGDKELLAVHNIIYDYWTDNGAKKNDEFSINLNLLVLGEINRRELKYKENELDKICKDFKKIATRLRERTVPNTDREKEMLEFAKNLKEFVVIPDYVSYSGSSVYAKDGHKPDDLDCIIRDSNLSEGLIIKLTRMHEFAMKAFKDSRGIHYCPDSHGPNWKYLPAYDLVLRPKKEFIFRDLEEKEFEKACYLEENYTHKDCKNFIDGRCVLKDKEVNPDGKACPDFIPKDSMNLLENQEEKISKDAIKSAELSAKQDKIVPLRFFYAMKPTKPDYKSERSSITKFIDFFKEGEPDFPMLVSKKYNGVNCIISKDKDKVKVWTEQGQDITSKIPRVVEAIKNIKVETFIVLAELEFWEGKKLFPREMTAGMINRKVPDDSDMIANIYTLVYIDDPDIHKDTKQKGDIHKLSEASRQKSLESLKYANLKQSTNGVPNIEMRLNMVPNTLVKNKKELEKAVINLSNKPGSEGVVIKKNNAVYYLDGNARNGWAKYHLTSVLNGIITEAVETKVADVYNYWYALDSGNLNIAQKNLEEVRDTEFAIIGKTFSSALKLNRGDIAIIEFETFNYVENEKDKTISASAWAPRLIGRSNKINPDTITQIKNRAEKARILSHKKITKDGETEFIMGMEEDYRSFITLEEYKQLEELANVS